MVKAKVNEAQMRDAVARKSKIQEGGGKKIGHLFIRDTYAGTVRSNAYERAYEEMVETDETRGLGCAGTD